jgi:hypothetical protein
MSVHARRRLPLRRTAACTRLGGSRTLPWPVVVTQRDGRSNSPATDIMDTGERANHGNVPAERERDTHGRGSLPPLAGDPHLVRMLLDHRTHPRSEGQRAHFGCRAHVSREFVLNCPRPQSSPATQDERLVHARQVTAAVPAIVPRTRQAQPAPPRRKRSTPRPGISRRRHPPLLPWRSRSPAACNAGHDKESAGKRDSHKIPTTN